MINAPEKRLIALADKHIKTTEKESPGGNLQNLYKNLQNPEMIIPVLGLQGVGKSTLINAILKEKIMPNEADETTCIPVEVRYGEKPSAWLFFPKGKEKKIRDDEIYKYVDNNYNPGNELNVSHIVIYRNMELFKTGIVLVDLPGVGSMTTANQETTTRYIKNLYSAIFMIRVNPPITRTEAIFIKAAWCFMSNAWFVQNRWMGESDREVEEGLDANTTILLDIADDFKIPYNKEIMTVHAHKALAGVLQNKPDNVAESNITELTGKLESISANWRESAEEQYKERVLGIVALIKGIIGEEIKNCGMTKAGLKAKLKKEEELFDETTRKTREQVAKIKVLLGRQKAEAESAINDMVKKAIEKIRANIYYVVDGGVTDGEDLTKAFRDYQVQEFEIVSNDYLYFVKEKLSELAEQMEELRKLLEKERKASFTGENFYRKQKFKWEKGLNAGIKIGGAVAAIFAFGKIGALIGTAVFPGFGTIVGFAAGVVVGLAASFIGGKIKQLVTAERAREAKRQLADVIDELREKMTVQLMDSFADICGNVSDMLEEFCKDRITEAKQDKILNNLRIMQDENTNRDLQRELEDDMKYLTSMEEKIHA